MENAAIQGFLSWWEDFRPWADSIEKNDVRHVLEKTNQVGSLNSPFSVCTYRNWLLPAGFEKTPLHVHDFYELIFCHGSHGIKYLINSEWYYPQKGDIIFIPPKCPHQPFPEESLTKPYFMDVFCINADFLSSLIQTHPEYRIFSQIPARILQTESADRGAVESYLLKEGNAQLISPENILPFLDLFKELLANQKALHKNTEQLSISEQIAVYIEEHLDEKISLTDTAAYFHVSKSTLSQVFLKETGSSFHQYVIQQRLFAAKKLILQDVPLEEVSARVGFCDYSAFYRAFRKKFGVSPRQFRQLPNHP